MPKTLAQNFMFLNTYLMDFSLAKLVDSDASKIQVKERTRELARYVVREDIDIAAFCEFWTTEVKDIFFKTGWGLEGNAMYDSGLGIGKVDSKRIPDKSTGLFSVSKEFPFEPLPRGAERHLKFRHEGDGADKRVSKGVLYGTINPGLGVSRLEVFSTHLVASGAVVNGVDHRWVQMLELAHWVSTVGRRENHAIVAGDFNIDAHDTVLHEPRHKITEDNVSRYPLPWNPLSSGAMTEYDFLTRIMRSIGFRDLWLTNGTPGYTSDVSDSRVASMVCPADDDDSRFCSDNISTCNDARRIDFVFVKEANDAQSFAIDYSIPRRMRIVRSADAPERDKLPWISDHLGLFSTLSMTQVFGERALWADGVDAAIMHPTNGTAYFFKGNEYRRYVFGENEGVDRRARIGVDGWKGVWENGVDAAIMHPTNGRAYFFKDNEYRRYVFGEGVDKTGRIGVDGWKGIWKDGVDAVIVHPTNGRAYFFKGKEYRRYVFGENEGVDRTARIGVDGWKGVWEDGVDAAIIHPTNGHGYFFKDNEYRRYVFGEGVNMTGRIAIDGWTDRA